MSSRYYVEGVGTMCLPLKNWQCTVKQSFVHLCLNCKPINKIGRTNKWTILNCFETKHTSMQNGFQQRMEKLSKVCSACQTLSARNFLIFWKVNYYINYLSLLYIFVLTSSLLGNKYHKMSQDEKKLIALQLLAFKF